VFPQRNRDAVMGMRQQLYDAFGRKEHANMRRCAAYVDSLIGSGNADVDEFIGMVQANEAYLDSLILVAESLRSQGLLG
jgi:hypothetical protein